MERLKTKSRLYLCKREKKQFLLRLMRTGKAKFDKMPGLKPAFEKMAQ